MHVAEAHGIVAELIRRGTEAGRKWCPHVPSPKQLRFKQLDCLEGLYGGSAGGGKTDCLLDIGLEHVDVPGHAALLLQKTFADLALPGALMDRSHAWLDGTPAHWNGSDKTWSFPSGARLTFGYMETERDKYRYRSSEFQTIGWDELTRFSATQYRYMFTRLRRPSHGPASKIPLRMRAATNPGDVGHVWVKNRFRPDLSVDGQMVWHEGRAFVPARLDDNDHIDREAYEAALEELDETTRRQYRDGVWVQDGSGLVYPFDPDVALVPELPSRNDWRLIWVADFGASESKPTSAVGVTAFSMAHRQVYLAESEKMAGMHPSALADRFRQDEARWRERMRHMGQPEWRGFVQIIGDQGGLGGGYIKEFRERHAIPMEGIEKSDKLGVRKLLRDDLAHGRLLVVEPHNDAWIEEANELTWNEKGTDNLPGQPNHATDMALYGWRAAKHWLAKEPEHEPEPGSAEAAALEAVRMKQARAAKVRGDNADKRKPTWARGRRR